MTKEQVNILLVEDNEGDIVLINEALLEAEILTLTKIIQDGLTAIKYLEKTGIEDPTSLPDIIILDINLPKLNGLEVLERLKNDENLRKIPVIILTSSSSEKDICQAYGNYANCYIVKPINMDEFIEVILSIENFWTSTVKLP
jgi:CheY-like chemotaxis protein